MHQPEITAVRKPRKVSLIPYLSLPFLAGLPLTVSATEWPQWRGPARTGVVAASVAKSGTPSMEKIWEGEVGVGCASPVISGGKLFTVGHENGKDTVWCLDAATGKVAWRHDYDAELLPQNYDGGPAGTPTLDGGVLYTYSREGLVQALDAATGKVKWKVDVTKTLGGKAPQWGYSSSPLVHGELVILDVGGPGASSVAFNKGTGAVVWKTGDDKAGYSSPVLFNAGGTPTVAMFNEYGLVLLEVTSGKPVARHRWETSYGVNAATPVIVGDSIFISSGYGVGCAMLKYSEGKLEEVWRNKEMRNQFLSSVYKDGVIYGFDEKGTLKALDAASGRVRWEEKTGAGQHGAVIISGDLLILQYERGQIVLAKASGDRFDKVAEFAAVRPRSWVTPAVAGDVIYSRNNGGSLAAVRVK